MEVAREKEMRAKGVLETAEAMDSKVIAQKMASREYDLVVNVAA